MRPVDSDAAARAHALADRLDRLSAYDHRRPEAWHDDKRQLVRDIRAFAISIVGARRVDPYCAVIEKLNRSEDVEIEAGFMLGRRRRETRTTTEDRSGRSIPVVRKARAGFSLG